MARKNFFFPRYSSTNVVVRSGLSITPAQVYERAKGGIPVAEQVTSEGQFDEGDYNIGYDVPLQFQRGVDMNILWDAQRTSRKQLKSFNIGSSNG